MRITKILHESQGTYLLESVWHKGLKKVNRTQTRSFYPMPDPRFNEWYKTEVARDREYQTTGTAVEQQRRDRLEAAEQLGLRDDKGRFIGGDRALGVAVSRNTHDWLSWKPGNKMDGLIIPPDAIEETTEQLKKPVDGVRVETAMQTDSIEVETFII
ncbi:hypothetical protein GNI_223830 [Gregarina niphandrodes]|uniref:Uncharacterized protein n=1 Tax=Gregarina niphandrodes TaxID=110365 RepID=A0A023AVJ0_GRENI|nr:hypothetical protein GNI_223830 [Gregarina niphandrodes]EZG42799.1 hypothetical protein GNI_223830 [Gregarina niphandrodes]|eukprot:XP_011133922.1 hypothetical protein GNI_223830 [Gregarina niphandrodes]